MDLYNGDLAWLESELEIARSDPSVRAVVVITHHAPLTAGTSAPCFAGSPGNACFASDLARLMDPSVALWVYGHTHHSAVIQTDAGTVVASNQKGYPREDPKDVGFHHKKVFVV